MGVDNYIGIVISGVLKNPILSVLREIKIAAILKQCNFIKLNVGYAPYQVLLHFVYMLIMNKRNPLFLNRAMMLAKKTCTTDTFNLSATTGANSYSWASKH